MKKKVANKKKLETKKEQTDTFGKDPNVNLCHAWVSSKVARYSEIRKKGKQLLGEEASIPH